MSLLPSKQKCFSWHLCLLWLVLYNLIFECDMLESESSANGAKQDAYRTRRPTDGPYIFMLHTTPCSNLQGLLTLMLLPISTTMINTANERQKLRQAHSITGSEVNALLMPLVSLHSVLP